MFLVYVFSFCAAMTISGKHKDIVCQRYLPSLEQKKGQPAILIRAVLAVSKNGGSLEIPRNPHPGGASAPRTDKGTTCCFLFFQNFVRKFCFMPSSAPPKAARTPTQTTTKNNRTSKTKGRAEPPIRSVRPNLFSSRAVPSGQGSSVYQICWVQKVLAVSRPVCQLSATGWFVGHGRRCGPFFSAMLQKSSRGLC